MVSRSGVGTPGSWERDRTEAARVARLATVRPDGRPHVVPITFALHDTVVVTAVDSKPKRTTRLQRLRNIAAQPAVSVLVDSYDEDWSRLWWVRLDGLAEVVSDADRREECLATLVEKYAHYRQLPPAGPVIAVRLVSWASWTAAG
ncbi:MAG: TIGR03668 family PPOX class F420-dependent oxidoreductase [Actinomycetes bacterium]